MDHVCDHNRTLLYRRLRNLKGELDKCRPQKGDTVVQMHALRVKLEIERVESELRG